MANEIWYSNSGDLVLSETLNQEFLLALADRGYPLNHPALYYVGDLQGKGSLTLKTSEIGWMGYDILADVANEDTVATQTALTDSSHTVTVARKAMERNVGQALLIAGAPLNFSDPATWAADAAGAAAGKLVDMLANVADDFTNQTGPGSGADLNEIDLVTTAVALQVANVQGRLMCLLHPQQWGDVQIDVTGSAGGAFQYSQDAQRAMLLSDGSYKATLHGLIDVYSSSRVPTANSGADRAGAMFGRGGILWGDASINVDPDARAIYLGIPSDDEGNVTGGAKVMVEMDRNPHKAWKVAVYNAYLGATKGIDAAGRTIISDA